jgi:hypothetical protein
MLLADQLAASKDTCGLLFQILNDENQVFTEASESKSNVCMSHARTVMLRDRSQSVFHHI